MPSEIPRNNTTKKREQLQRREQELAHAIRSGLSRDKLVSVVEDLRAAQLSLLKAELYWADNARIQGRDVEDRLVKLHSDIQGWAERSIEDILRDHKS